MYPYLAMFSPIPFSDTYLVLLTYPILWTLYFIN